ncbi:MAG: GAF domain-containing protein [Deltaproteobacteria bacterium]|nr:GAF domain-containing protein [Deltaproteobacteria bacterium]
MRKTDIISKLKYNRLIPVLVGIATVVGALVLWQLLSAWEYAEIEHMVSLKTASVKDDIRDNVEFRINALVRMAKRLELESEPERREWEADAGLYYEHDRNYRSIAWIAPSFTARWVVPAGLPEFNMVFAPKNPAFATLAKAKDTRRVHLSGALKLPDGKTGFIAAVPVFSFMGERFNGFIAATFESQGFFHNLLAFQRETNEYSIEVYNEGRLVYSSDPEDGSPRPFAHMASAELYGSVWLIKVWPRADYLRRVDSSLPEAVLISGLLTSVMLSLAIYFAQVSLIKGGDLASANAKLMEEIAERVSAERKSARLTRLYSVLTMVNEAIVRLRDPQELYERVCRIAVEEGEFVMTWVGLLGPGESEIRPVAHAGREEGYLDSARITVSDGSPRGRGPTGSALREGKYFICDDFAADERMWPWRDEALLRGYRSSAAFPLIVRGNVAGALTLYAGEPDFFDSEQIQLLTALSADLSFAMESTDAEFQRRRAEEELNVHREQLEEAVEARTRELKDLNDKLSFEVTVRRGAEDAITKMNTLLEKRADELEAVNKELEAFTYSASHDLQEPLRVVSGYVQLLAKRYSGKLDKDAEEFISFAVEGVRRMQRLINDLLSYSRIGKVKEFGIADCEDVLKGALADLKALIDETGATVTHSPLPVLAADFSQMSHLFMNLIGNSIKYRSSAPPLIRISAERKGAEWLFAFRDNGIGIDPRYFERIFDIFQRLHGKAAHSGSGIGLSICKKVVENHGGRIWVESQPNEGTTFYFTIPMKEEDHEGE